MAFLDALQLRDSGGTLNTFTGTSVDINVTGGTIAATQSGLWNINNISGTIPLPTGAATEATLATLLTDTQLRATPVPVSATNLDIRDLVFATDKVDVSGSTITATPTGTQDVNIISTITLPISAAALPLPTGASTSALQTTSNTSLASIDGKLTAPLSVAQSGAWTTGRTWTLASGTDSVSAVQSGTWTVQPGNTANTTAWLVTGTGGTFPITAAALPLPTGASTSALQTTGNTSLASIDTKLVQEVLDFGVSTAGVRTASLIGNATGGASFNAGTTGAQTLRVVLPTDQTAIPVTTVIPGVAATNLGKAEDDVASSGDTGVADWGVRQDALTVLTSADGDYSAKAVDRYGRTKIDNEENPTFVAFFDRIVPAGAKSMATVFNTSATQKVVIRKITRLQNQLAAVAGVVLDQSLNRITGRTIGTAVTPVQNDTADALPAGVTASTNDTVLVGTTLYSRFLHSNEEVTTRAQQSSDLQGIEILYLQDPGEKGIVLRVNQGLTIINTTVSVVGTCSYAVYFTTEDV